MAEKKEKPKKPSELADALLALLKDNAKPVVRRTGANKLELELASGKRFAFEVSARVEKKRKDIS